MRLSISRLRLNADDNRPDLQCLPIQTTSTITHTYIYIYISYEYIYIYILYLCIRKHMAVGKIDPNSKELPHAARTLRYAQCPMALLGAGTAKSRTASARVAHVSTRGKG